MWECVAQQSCSWRRSLLVCLCLRCRHRVTCTPGPVSRATGVPTGGPALPTTDLFTDDPDGGAAAAGLGAAGAAAVAGTLGGRAAPLWAKLRSLLAAAAAADVAAEAAGGAGGGGGLRAAWMLRDAAAEAVLRVDPRVDLPQWLLDMFLAEEVRERARARRRRGYGSCRGTTELAAWVGCSD